MDRDLLDAFLNIGCCTGGMAKLEKIIADATNAILSGKGTVSNQSSGSINARSFSVETEFNAVEVLNAANKAKAICLGIEDYPMGSHYVDFKIIGL